MLLFCLFKAKINLFEKFIKTKKMTSHRFYKYKILVQYVHKLFATFWFLAGIRC